MDIGDFEHWGVVVRPGETVKCDPGELYCHLSLIALQAGKGNEDVRVFVKVDGKEILIGTLSVDRYPQYRTDLVFEKEFELLHTSKTSNISAIGYKFSKSEAKPDISAEEDDDSDEEVPLAIPLYPNAADDKSEETKSGAEKLAAPKSAAAQSSNPNITLDETKNPGKLKAVIGGSNDDDSDEEGESGHEEDSSDEDDSESSDEGGAEDSPEITKGKNRPAETPVKTPPEKKAKIATPSMGNKTGSGSAKKSGHIHVATPYPSSKQVKKTLSINDNSKQSTGYACTSCSKTFHSSVGLETHCKVKHSAHK
uniref:C2H2-type domain-containing protein n=1 Tax=Arundo donax TaxID=35708 RepID=A0A0A9GI37_ARUDO